MKVSELGKWVTIGGLIIVVLVGPENFAQWFNESFLASAKAALNPKPRLESYLLADQGGLDLYSGLSKDEIGQQMLDSGAGLEYADLTNPLNAEVAE